MPHLAFAPDGTAHLCYRTAEGLRYAVKEGEAWHIETLSTAGADVAIEAFQVDSAGFPHLTYVDKATDTVMYLYQDDRGWYVEPIGDVSFISDHRLALDAQGVAHILFRDGRNGGLTHGVREADGWHFAIAVADIPDTLSDYDFAMGPDGIPRVVYHTYNGPRLGDLWYASYGQPVPEVHLPLLLRQSALASSAADLPQGRHNGGDGDNDITRPLRPER
jgi:hypothetical protein